MAISKRHKKRFPLCWFMLLLAPSLAGAQPQTLRETVKNAVLTNPEVLSRWHTFKAAGEERDAAFGPFLPRLDLSAGKGRESRDDPLLQSDYTRNSATLTLTQMLYDGFATRNEVKRLDHARLVRALELQDNAENIALETARAYFDVLRYRKLVNLAEENYIRHRSVFEQIEKKVQAGVGRRVDLEQASGRLALAEANLLTETSNLHDVSARFQRIAGEFPAREMEEISNLSQDLPKEAGSALKIAQTGHPALRASIENVRSASYAASVRSAAFQPRVDLRFKQDHGQNLNGYIGQHENKTAEVVLSWNLFNGLSDVARKRQFIEQANVARDLRDKACRDIRQNLAIAYNDVRKLNEQMNYLDQHQLSIEKARDAYRKQFDIGQRTLLDLLDTENELFQAKRAYSNAEHDLAIAYVRTQAGMGRLLPALGVSAKHEAEVPELENWAAGEDAATQCPADAVTLYTADKNALNARALQMHKESQPVEQAQPEPVAPVTPENEVAQALKAWSTAWSGQNIEAYLNAYAPDFMPADGSKRETWAARRKNTISRAQSLSLEITGIKLNVRDPQHATTSFRQAYGSTAYRDVALKTLEWERQGNNWLIVRETAEAPGK
ncbi:MAG: TolC family outer membrane protein [Sulfuricella sp.]